MGIRDKGGFRLIWILQWTVRITREKDWSTRWTLGKISRTCMILKRLLNRKSRRLSLSSLSVMCLIRSNIRIWPGKWDRIESIRKEKLWEIKLLLLKLRQKVDRSGRLREGNIELRRNSHLLRRKWVQQRTVWIEVWLPSKGIAWSLMRSCLWMRLRI